MTRILEQSVRKSAMGRPALKLSFLTFDCYGFHAQCLSLLSIQGETKLSPMFPERMQGCYLAG